MSVESLFRNDHGAFVRHHVSSPGVLDADPHNHLPPKGLWTGVMGAVIFLEGYDAQRDGLPRGINPYLRFGEESCKAWEAGWDQANVEKPNEAWSVPPPP